MTFSTKEMKKENLVYLDNLHKREEGRRGETRREATRRGDRQHGRRGSLFSLSMAHHLGQLSMCLSANMCGMPITKLMCRICCHCFYRNERQQKSDEIKSETCARICILCYIYIYGIQSVQT